MLERPKSFAFLFEGQGNQFPGMWSDLYKRNGEGARVFDLADRLSIREGLPFRITDACFKTEGKILTGQEYDPVALQLAILTGETATAAELHARGVPRANANAGHSLGQLAAGVESRFWGFETAFKFTVVRSRAMDKVAQARNLVVCVISDVRKDAGSLVADTQKALRELGDETVGTKITGFNTKKQLVATGPMEELEKLKTRFAETLPGIRLRPMPKIPFSHHPAMSEAQKEVNVVLKKLKLEFNHRAKSIHLADIKDGLINGANSYRGALGIHLVSAVLWSANWRRLKNLGIETAVEIGPGEIFPNMAKVDFPGLEVLLTKNISDIDLVIERLGLPTRTYAIPNSSVE